MAATTPLNILSESKQSTTVGSYFVSNYPPYSFWKAERTADAVAAMEREPAPGNPLGIYLHIPFCRKRCHFCYFKVYTDKAANEIETYLDTVLAELRLYAQKPLFRGRKPKFIYFGGGTPSYISTQQLKRLVDGFQEIFPWTDAEEVAFECEPGTVTEAKLRLIREMGVTRISLGIENFKDELLTLNGRAHTTKEIDRVFGFIRGIGFPQINLDLIAGMVGETDDNWRDCVKKTIDFSPDSVTIYQMEVPHNTLLSKAMKEAGATEAPVADWATKRRWVDYAFAELENAGYHIGSAYTAVKNGERTKFLYRDMLWAGADMLGVGVASFSHAGGTHFQNEHEIGSYMEKVNAGTLPLFRACTPNAEERMIREFILQMKLGALQPEYFRNKFGVDVEQRFSEPLEKLRQLGFVERGTSDVRLSRDGLMRVDGLLPEFYLAEHARR